MSEQEHIAIRGLEVAYGKQVVLDGVDLAIARGSFTALLGASGCGKTTLLRTLSGFVEARAGEIKVGGRDVLALPPDARGMAMVFQSYALWPHMSVAQNIGYGLKLRGVTRSGIAAKVGEMLALLDLAGFEERRVTELSGGQRQRVALGRALAIDPQILLLDEPLSNLDARIRVQMRHEIRALQRKLALTAILVTHDREEAMAMADRVVVMGDGRVAQHGTPEDVFRRPVSPYVASFMGAENVLHGHLASRAGTVSLALAGGVQAEFSAATVFAMPLPESRQGESQIHFRSEAAYLRSSETPLADTLQIPGKVASASFLGNSYRCAIDTDCGRFMIDHAQRPDSASGVSVCVPAGALLVYPRASASATLSIHP